MSSRIYCFFLIAGFLSSCHQVSDVHSAKYKKVILNSNGLKYDSVLSLLKNNPANPAFSLEEVYKKYLPDSVIERVRKSPNVLDSGEYNGKKVYESYVEIQRNKGLAVYSVQGDGELIFVELMDDEDPAHISSYILETGDNKTDQLISSVISDRSFFVLNKLNRKTPVEFKEPQ